MKYFDTFTGIGGFTLGIQQAYEILNMGRPTETPDSEKGRHQSMFNNSNGNGRRTDTSIPECIGFSEIDKYASAIYQHHFPTHKNYGDITKINAEELPDFDLLVGGFPCQAFSIAGKRKGFDDTRGTLFFDLARILRAKQPRLFVFENVKGLLSHDNGNTFRTIMSTIAELGYDAQWKVLNSKNHGVPQNRERIYIVGHLRGTRRPEVFPFGENGQFTNDQKRQVSRGVSVVQQGGLESDNQSRDSKNGENRPIHQLNNPPHSNDRVYGADGISLTLNTMTGGNRQPFILHKDLNKMVSYKYGKTSKLDDRALEGKEKFRGEKECMLNMSGEKKDGDTSQGWGLAQQQGRELRGNLQGLSHEAPQEQAGMFSAELQSNKQEIPVLREAQPEIQEVRRPDAIQEESAHQNYKIRRLTCLECERLQAFPDNWTNVCGTSDSQRYKCCGNAVTVNVVRDIMIKILTCPQ